MKRFGMAMAVAAMVIAIPSPVAAAETCTYNAANHKVTVTMTGASTNTALYRAPAPYTGITLNGEYCGSATITNTDTVVVTGDGQSQRLTITLATGLLAPGFTNEPGSSDEIEWIVNLGGGQDTLRITGNDNVNKFVLGQNNSQAGTPRAINLNAGESTGIDGDVTFSNVENVTVYGMGGNDVIRAQGKTGTGPDPLTMGLLIYGGPGDDVIRGSEAEDRIYGDEGKDTIYGNGTGDFIHLNDGSPGDKGYGGGGNDAIYFDDGDIWQQD